MTLDELNQYASKQAECLECYQNIIAMYGRATNISAPTGESHHGSFKSDKPAIAADIVTEREKLEQLQSQINAQTKAVIDYIMNIEDSFVRRIFTYRFIHALDWESVAEKLGTSSYSVKHTCYRYLKRH